MRLFVLMICVVGILVSCTQIAFQRKPELEEKTVGSCVNEKIYLIKNGRWLLEDGNLWFSPKEGAWGLEDKQFQWYVLDCVKRWKLNAERIKFEIGMAVNGSEGIRTAIIYLRGI